MNMSRHRITTGLVSITFRQLTPEAVIDLVKQAGQDVIEWGGDVHVPHGDLAQAREVRTRTQEAGLHVAAYGSYYRAGHHESETPSFTAVLETTLALGASAIRIWAGHKPLAEVDAPYRARVTDDIRRVADLAAEAGLLIVLEYHRNTLTETDASAQQLLRDVDHPHVRTLWQPHNGVDPAQNAGGLRDVLPWVHYLHVFHWWPTSKDRHPLTTGATVWRNYLAILRHLDRPCWTLLEFVPNDDPGAYLRDAATLQTWIDELNQSA